MSRLRGIMGARALWGGLAGLLLALLVYLPWQPGPAIALVDGEATISFRADRRWLLLPSDCATLSWSVDRTVSVYLDGSGVIGSDSRLFCPKQTNSFSATLLVNKRDGTSREFKITLMPMYTNVLIWGGLIVLALCLLQAAPALWKPSMVAWGFILFGSVVLIAHEFIPSFYSTLFQGSLVAFDIRQGFASLLLYGCFVTALYWLVIPIQARSNFLVGISLFTLILLDASLEFVLLIVSMIALAYTASVPVGEPKPTAPRAAAVQHAASLFYLILVEIILLVCTLLGNVWVALSTPLVVGVLFLLTLLIAARFLTPLQMLPLVAGWAGAWFYYAQADPSTLIAQAILLLALIYFIVFAYLALRVLRSGGWHSSARRVGYVAVGTILLAFLVLKWPPLRTGLAISGWIGFSYFAFRLLHVLIDSFNRRYTDVSLSEMAIYSCFYPTILSGPIDRLPRFLKELRGASPVFKWHFVSIGLMRLAIGCVKKFFLVDVLLSHMALGVDLPLPSNSLSAWSQVFCYSLYILLDFSSYIDIALGTAYMLGLTLPENFDLPYFKTNIALFWQSWHITLSNWFRTYVFFPVSNRLLRTPLRKHPTFVLFVAQTTTMLLIGLWHGITWNFVLWGLWNALGLFVHRLYTDQIKQFSHLFQEHPTFRRVYSVVAGGLTFTFVSLGWVFFALPDPSSSLQVFLTLFNLK